MNAIELRSELIELIKRTEDVKMLEWLKGILTEPAMSQEMIDDMIAAAEASEEDIAAGRTYTIEETKRWLDDRKREA
jgi:predicted transcriptional regulator